MVPIRVTISDDHAILRTGLRAIIADKDDLTVVGEADCAEATLEVVGREQPDVAIVDVAMGDATGISVLPTLKKNSPNTRFLLLTMHGEAETVREGLRAGADGYLIKEAHHEEVMAAIRTLAQGRSYVSVPISGGGFTPILGPADNTTGVPSLPRPLSAREHQVLVLFARGRTHREIARELGVRLKTVETYRSRLGDKLGARTKADLLRCASELGLLDGEDLSPAATDVPS